MRILEVLKRESHHSRAANALERCGDTAWVLRSVGDTPRYRIALNRCKHRLCLPCQQQRARVILYNLLDNAPRGRFRFVTLTVKSRQQPLAASIKHLYDSFRNLRRSAWWRGLVTGGVAFLEVTKNATNGLWHPHLHLLVQGKFLPLDEVRERWHATTGDSYIVDVRSPNHVDQLASYVTRYAARDYDREILRTDATLLEYLAGTRGVRAVFTFGSFTRLKLLASINPEGEWEFTERASDLIRRALAGEPDALQIAYTLWQQHWSVFERRARTCPLSCSE